jgi:hypothetical protein
VPAFNLSSFFGRHIPVEDILIRINDKRLSWRSYTETRTEVVGDSVPLVPSRQNLPDSKPFSLFLTKNWDSLQSLVIGDENGLKSGRFRLHETEGAEFIVIEIVF